MSGAPDMRAGMPAETDHVPDPPADFSKVSTTLSSGAGFESFPPDDNIVITSAGPQQRTAEPPGALDRHPGALRRPVRRHRRQDRRLLPRHQHGDVGALEPDGLARALRVVVTAARAAQPLNPPA